MERKNFYGIGGQKSYRLLTSLLKKPAGLKFLVITNSKVKHDVCLERFSEQYMCLNVPHTAHSVHVTPKEFFCLLPVCPSGVNFSG